MIPFLKPQSQFSFLLSLHLILLFLILSSFRLTFNTWRFGLHFPSLIFLLLLFLVEFTFWNFNLIKTLNRLLEIKNEPTSKQISKLTTRVIGAINFIKQNSEAISMSSNLVTKALNFVVCVGGIYGCYLQYGYLQEKMYHSPFPNDSTSPMPSSK